VNKYLSLTRHMYSAMFFIGGKKTWDKLTPDEQKVIQAAADEAKTFQRNAAREINAKALVSLKKTMVVNEIPEVEMAKMRERAKPVIEKWTREVGPELVGEVNAELSRVRAAK